MLPYRSLLSFILCLWAIFKCKPPGAYFRRGGLTAGFLRYEFGGLIFGGACTWRGLFSEFYVYKCMMGIFSLRFLHFLALLK